MIKSPGWNARSLFEWCGLAAFGPLAMIVPNDGSPPRVRTRRGQLDRAQLQHPHRCVLYADPPPGQSQLGHTAAQRAGRPFRVIPRVERDWKACLSLGARRLERWQNYRRPAISGKECDRDALVHMDLQATQVAHIRARHHRQRVDAGWAHRSLKPRQAIRSWIGHFSFLIHNDRTYAVIIPRPAAAGSTPARTSSHPAQIARTRPPDPPSPVCG